MEIAMNGADLGFEKDRWRAADALSVFERVETAIGESRMITALSDALRPKLISGELRVPGAERIAGRVL